MTVYQLPFALEDGMQIKLVGQPRIYPKSGKFSLTVKSLELVGEGALQKAFDDLKKKLEAEGLFDNKWKKPLPFFPKAIGLVTSKTGDALQDILRIMRNRAGGLKILLAPVAVQGQSAVSEVTNAISYFNSHQPVDLIIVARGGGSLEDLQAFNSEPVARAIFASKIPIVTGVGHEPDTTLADLVADVRAATPTNAAEIAVPDFEQLGFELDQSQKHLAHAVNNLVTLKKHNLDLVLHRMRSSLSTPIRQTDLLKSRLLNQLKAHINKVWQQKVGLESLGSELVGLNPEKILERGYSIASDADGNIIKSAKQVKIGQKISNRFHDGKVESEVSNIKQILDKPE